MKLPMLNACMAFMMTLGFWQNAFADMAADAPLSDAKILAVFMTANNGEIQSSQLAKSLATDAQVKAFAEHMINDHSSAITQTLNLMKKDALLSEESALSKTLRDGTKKDIAKLKTLKRAAFDLQYITIQVKAHQTVLDLMDRTLIPEATSSDLKALLEKSRVVISQHLATAKKIQARLTG